MKKHMFIFGAAILFLLLAILVLFPKERDADYYLQEDYYDFAGKDNYTFTVHFESRTYSPIDEEEYPHVTAESTPWCFEPHRVLGKIQIEDSHPTYAVLCCESDQAQEFLLLIPCLDWEMHRMLLSGARPFAFFLKAQG